jgi:hypothetical protein
MQLNQRNLASPSRWSANSKVLKLYGLTSYVQLVFGEEVLVHVRLNRNMGDYYVGFLRLTFDI